MRSFFKNLTVLCLCFIMLLLSSCTSQYNGLKNPLPDAQPSEPTVSNGGLACRQGDWLYYINGDNFTRMENERYSEFAGALCRMRVDGTQKAVVVDKDVSLFSVQGEKIYLCIYEQKNSYIASANIDGSNYVQHEKIDDIYLGGGFAFSGEYIYYTKDYFLYRWDKKGNNTRITDFEIYNLRACDEYVYFTRDVSGEIGNAYRLDNGKTEPVEITNTPSYIIDCYDNVAYYYVLGNKNAYCYSAETGSAKAVVYGGYTDYLFEKQLDFYAVSYTVEVGTDDDGIFIIPSGGGAKRQVSENSGKCMAYYNGYIYYVNATKLNYLYRCSVDGLVDECISEEFVYDYDKLDIVDNYLYFLSDSDYDSIYRVNMDDGKVECIEFEEVSIVG